MDKPKWLKFIATSGILLSIILVLLTVTTTFGTKQPSISYLVLPFGIALFLIYTFLKLYQLKNWAREIIILYSAVSLIPVFKVKMDLFFSIYGLCSIPFYLFYLVYLLRTDVRASFTDKKRSVVKFIFAGIVVLITIGFSSLITSVETGKPIGIAKALFESQSKEYKSNRETAERLLGISFPQDYKIERFKDYLDFSLLGMFVGGKNEYWGEQYVIILDLKDKNDITLDEVTSFIFNNENLKGMAKRMQLEDKKILQFNSVEIPALKIKYGTSKGLLGSYKSSRHTVIFISYVFGTDQTKELNEDYLKKALTLFD